MGTLTYATTVSLDGYVADPSGDFQWSAPSEAVFAAHLERMRHVSTEILGRKTYELMRYWHSEPSDEQWSSAEQEFAKLWRNINTFAASSTLTSEQLASTHDALVPALTVDRIVEIAREASGVVEIFGPTTAAPAIRAGVVEVFEFFIVPKVLGGGLPALPQDARLELKLTDHRIFDDGTVHVRYSPTHGVVGR
ncbi:MULTISPECIES: dihydrofolate reductase family protein [Kocuria]|uniref:Dihydrofolate reductase family protein n=1 Tax=Kocuria subflava TaxID=1736139 RepID=A0A846TR49_9MICC|nr:dihydrofolate reductase family protein [Kocuria sp. CPCC 104605]NKE09289.1 dihydrofolate reductase family protein [Kocuria subflava]